jgi:DNA-binding transcriptional LysR family regulator
VEFDDIRAFLAVAEARSVSRAARERHLTQPAVSRRVQRLAAALGAVLCDRRRRPFTLTAAGQAALERCRRVLHAVRDVHSATGGDDPPAREIRVGVAHALTEVTLTEPVDRLRRAFPRVLLSLGTGWSHLLERVRIGALDAAVILLPDGERLPASLDATRLGRERLVVVEPRRGPRGPGLAALDGSGWVLNPEGCAARALLRSALHAAGVRLRVAVETYTYERQLALVARHRGLGLVPARILARSPLRARVRVRRVRGVDFPLTICAVRRETTPDLVPVFRALDRAMIERLSRRRRAHAPDHCSARSTSDASAHAPEGAPYGRIPGPRPLPPAGRMLRRLPGDRRQSHGRRRPGRAPATSSGGSPRCSATSTPFVK